MNNFNKYAKPITRLNSDGDMVTDTPEAKYKAKPKPKAKYDDYRERAYWLERDRAIFPNASEQSKIEILERYKVEEK